MTKNEKSTHKISLVDFCINFQHTYNILLSYTKIYKKKDDTPEQSKTTYVGDEFLYTLLLN